MKILFACGGTAGHINPAVAVADSLLAKDPSTEILFVGNPKRMEATLIPKEGYNFKGIMVEGFHRSFAPKSIVHNFKSVYYMLGAGAKAKKILDEFKPDIVMGTGGYVSGPMLRTAAKLGYKTITHESNSYPGITTKLLVDYVDKVLLVNEDTKKYLPQSDKYIVTGNPIRPDIMGIDKEAARKKLGIANNLFCVLSFGGSNGSEVINATVAEVIARLAEVNCYSIHATGVVNKNLFASKLAEFGVLSSDSNLDIRDYIYNMSECLAAADLVVCRSGAITLTELAAVGRAAILIPSPYVAENHQYHNAMTMVKRNAALIIEQQDLDADTLYGMITELMNDPIELEGIAANAKGMFKGNAADVICDEIYKLLDN